MELAPRGTQPGRTVNIRVFETNKVVNRVGAVKASLFPAKWPSEKAENSMPLAHFRPLSFRETNGFTVLTSSSVIIYYPGQTMNESPQIRYEYLLTVKDLTFESHSVPSVPAVTKLALITDHRTPNRGEYLADRWLNADERGRAVRTSLPAGNDPLAVTGRKRTAVIIAMIALMVAGAGLAFKVVKTNQQKKEIHI